MAMAMAMAKEKTASSLPLIFFLFMLILSFNTGGFFKLVNGDQKTWCVAKPSSDDWALQNNIDYVRNQGIDTGIFEGEGCPCYKPNTLINHASVAMNLYYQKYGRNIWNCNFTSSGLITTTDPSYDKCKYI